MIHAQPLFMASPTWRTAFLVSYLGWAVMEMWIFSRDRRPAKGVSSDRGSLRALVMLVWAGLGGAFVAAQQVGSARIALAPQPVFWSGIAGIWLGMALRSWAVLTLGRFFRVTVRIQEDHRLITSGPYAVLRNPSYTGGLISMAGVVLALGNWLSLAWAAACLLAGYGWRIRTEEAALASRFGQAWTDYRRRTWALIPFVW